MRLVVAIAISTLLVAGCSSSVPKSAPATSELPTSSVRSAPSSAPITSASAALPTTAEGFREAGYRKADSADPTEKSGYYVRPAGIFTTAITNSGRAYELIGARLDITSDPLATGNSSIDADEYSVDDNNTILNDVVGDYTNAVAKICGTYPPIEKAAAAAGLAENPNHTGSSVDVYELKPGTKSLKACLIYEDDPGVTYQKVILDESAETNPALTVPSEDGFTIWYGSSVAVS